MASIAGWCDCHVHVVGDPARYPLDRSRTYKPGLAPLARLQEVARPLGIDRFVIVQPSFYGTDNSLVLDTLATLTDRGRGIAVIDPETVGGATLDRMAAGGVRGLRMNLYSTAPDEPLGESFGRQAAVAGDQGWHVQVIAPLPVLVEAADVLARSPVPVVIDHYGLFDQLGPASVAGRIYLDLLRAGHVWVKLSAPYRSGSGSSLQPDSGWLEAILLAAPDRCVWGSDWPHTPAHGARKDPDGELPYREYAYASVLDAFRSSLPDRGWADRILRDNPARLYGFAVPDDVDPTIGKD